MSRLRRKAQRLGYSIRKSRSRLSLDNQGEFMVIDFNNHLVLGDRFDASLDDVDGFLRDQEGSC